METNINPLSALSLFLVEDDDGDAKAVVRAFTRAKIANPIIRAIDGVEALEILRGQNGRDKPSKPHLLLIDINMPRMNGIELIKNIRQDPNLKRLVVFVLTTSKRDEDRVAAYDLNVAGYILKQRAGEDFVQLVQMMDYYWRIVEMP
ncbi:response regulator [Rhizobium halophytocola]|uniref:CheY-like chemotaxis protein n=2 Tax=Rhizobium halophytocola TaxID=735519 RepID=A0ABS4E6H8_9HYPH|nr:CheY-like chemotaxis protein [Rhizobium halophytocola]